MPTTKQLTAYARVLLQKGLNLQKGQTLVINALSNRTTSSPS